MYLYSIKVSSITGVKDVSVLNKGSITGVKDVSVLNKGFIVLKTIIYSYVMYLFNTNSWHRFRKN